MSWGEKTKFCFEGVCQSIVRNYKVNVCLLILLKQNASVIRFTRPQPIHVFSHLPTQRNNLFLYHHKPRATLLLNTEQKHKLTVYTDPSFFPVHCKSDPDKLRSFFHTTCAASRLADAQFKHTCINKHHGWGREWAPSWRHRFSSSNYFVEVERATTVHANYCQPLIKKNPAYSTINEAKTKYAN